MKKKVRYDVIFCLFIFLSCAEKKEVTEEIVSRDIPEETLLEVRSVLDSIYIEDQKYRREIHEFEEMYELGSKARDSLYKLIEVTDSMNQKVVKSILDSHGWLGYEKIGIDASDALFLVLQHADLETQLKYLPSMREAVERGDARSRDLAYLQDRVALGQGRMQIYGTQFGINMETGENYLLPLIKPKLVDQRRRAVGLGGMNDYFEIIGTGKWDPEAYERELPIIIEKAKKIYNNLH